MMISGYTVYKQFSLAWNSEEQAVQAKSTLQTPCESKSKLF